MLKSTRQQKIVSLALNGGSVEVSKLADTFQISPITIRRDLLELEEKGLLERTWGGAIGGPLLAQGWARYESVGYSERLAENLAAKRAIGEIAAQFVSDGDSVLLNAGTTTQLLASSLKAHRRLNVVTNGLTVATELAQSCEANVHMLPGKVDFKKMAAVEWPLYSGLQDMRVRAAFLGVHSISPTDGIAMNGHEDAMLNRAFMDMAAEISVLVDASKFSAHAIFRVSYLDRLQRVITDERAPEDQIRQIQGMGVEVLVAALDPAHSPGP